MGDNYFCYLRIGSDEQMISEIILLGVSFLLIANALRKFVKMRESHNRSVSFIYAMVLNWWITFLIANVYSIILYKFVVPDHKEGQDGEMSDLTKPYAAIDWLNAFLLQWLLLYVPYNWAKKIVELFGQQVERGSEVTLMEKQEYRGPEKAIYPTLKIYIRFRLLFLILPALLIIYDEAEIIFSIMILSLLLDCFFITFSLLLGMLSLKKTEQLQEWLDEEESRRMFNQYLMIIAANTIRFGFDIMVTFVNVFGSNILSPSCPSAAIANGDFVPSDLVFSICVAIFTHFLPVFLILRIYSLEENPEEICKSLIITTTDSQEPNLIAQH